MPFVVWINVCSQQLFFDQWNNLEIIIFSLHLKREVKPSVITYITYLLNNKQKPLFRCLFLIMERRQFFSASIQIFLPAIFIPVCWGLNSPRELSLSQNRYRIQRSFTSRTYWLPRALVTQSPVEQSLLGGEISGARRDVPSLESGDWETRTDPEGNKQCLSLLMYISCSS